MYRGKYPNRSPCPLVTVVHRPVWASTRMIQNQTEVAGCVCCKKEPKKICTKETWLKFPIRREVEQSREKKISCHLIIVPYNDPGSCARLKHSHGLAPNFSVSKSVNLPQLMGWHLAAPFTETPWWPFYSIFFTLHRTFPCLCLIAISLTFLKRHQDNNLPLRRDKQGKVPADEEHVQRTDWTGS